MKKLFAVLFVLVVLTSCNKQTQTPQTYSASLYTDQIGKLVQKHTFGEYTRKGFDSLCAVRNIPNDYKLWEGIAFRDYETGTPFIGYTYIVDSIKTDGIADETFKLTIKTPSAPTDTIFFVETREVVRK